MNDPLDRELLEVGLIVVLGAVTSMLDITIVSVALAGLAAEFHTSVGTIGWVGTGYLLALALVIPLTGWAVDRFGAKRAWLFALAVFLVGSVLCGAAWDVGSLIAFRVLQGVGGGMVLPLGQTILVRAAGPRRLGRVMGVVSVPGQLAPVLGPLIGGVIIDAAQWRWIFWVNVPLCLVALVLAWWRIPAEEANPAQRLDVRGLALLSPGLAAVLFGLSHRDAAPAAVGAVLLAAFAVHALRTRRTPLVDVRLFADRAFATSSVLLFLARVSIFGAMFLMPLYYQRVRGHDALTAGLLMAPQGIGTAVALLLVGGLTDRIGPRPVVLAGLATTMAATFAFTRITPDTSEIALAGALLVWGVGLAAAAVPVTAAAYRDLDRARVPRATSALAVVQSVGGPLGTALLVVVLEATGDYGDAFRWAFAFTGLSFAVALLLPRQPAPKQTNPTLAE